MTEKIAPTKSITFSLTVWATMPLVDNPDDPDFYTEAGATSPEFQRQTERAILTALRKAGDYQCECELVSYEVKEDAP